MAQADRRRSVRSLQTSTSLGALMIRTKLTFVLALIAVTAVVAGVAAARAVFLVDYSGQTSQVYKGKPSPSIVIRVDKTHNAVYYIGIAYKCTNTGKRWITRSYPSLKQGRINANCDFKYTTSSGKTRLKWISGHVTASRITGKFVVGNLGCKAQGTYKATTGGK